MEINLWKLFLVPGKVKKILNNIEKKIANPIPLWSWPNNSIYGINWYEQQPQGRGLNRPKHFFEMSVCSPFSNEGLKRFKLLKNKEK